MTCSNCEYLGDSGDGPSPSMVCKHPEAPCPPQPDGTPSTAYRGFGVVHWSKEPPFEQVSDCCPLDESGAT